MLAGANPSGVFTVSLNPTAPTLSQPPSSSVQSFHSASAIILPQPVQQVAQGALPQLVSGGQIVNLTPVRATGAPVEPVNSQNTPSNKNHACSYCHKTFSSRYNVTRHEKICKFNPTLLPVSEETAIDVVNNEPKQFYCEHCQKIFQTQDALNRHQKKCKTVVSQPKAISVADIGWTSRKVHLCKYCGKEFSTKWNVIRHEKLFHSPNDPVVVPQSVANGVATAVTVVSPPGKPERYCRFCGNYFSSKYNAIRHEKICTRIQTNSSNSSKPSDQPQQQQLPQTQTIQIQTQQQSAVAKPLQITSITGGSQTILIPDPTQQQQQVQQQQNAQAEQRIQQIVQQQPIGQQVQQAPQLQAANIQTNQGQQLLPQQTMLLIEQPTTPFHVCKFCNKQFSTRCDPGSHNLLTNVPTVATITGQPMQIGSSGTQIAGLVTPVMASLPQVTLVQPQFSTLQGQQLIQQHQLPAQQRAQIQQDKDTASSQPHQQPQAQADQANTQNEQVQHQQQITLQQHIRLPLQQQAQIQTVAQPNGAPNPTVDRPHACKFCDKHFASKWYLDQHEKIHTGEADMCKVCGKYFVTRWHLDKHMRVHLTNEPSPSKKAKKDHTVPTGGEVIPVDAVMTSHGTTIEFPHIIIEPGPTSTQTSLVPSKDQTFTVSSSNLVQQGLSTMEQPSANQPASSASTSTQPVASHADEHSTIDKSQIASITYT